MPSDEPTDGRCNAECRDGGYCLQYPVTGSDRCRMHGGTNDGAPEGNDNAVTVAAWADDFVSDFLRDDEIDRVKDLSELLEEPTTAQEVAARAASIALEQFQRTGDDRFLRRFESICDKAEIFPDEADTEVNVSLDDLYRD